MSSKQKRILVTGCAGFIGSHVVEHLIGEGYIVDGVDDFSSGQVENILESSSLIKIRHVPSWFVPRWETMYEENDSSDLVLFHDDFMGSAIAHRIASGKYFAVLHLAAEPSVENSIKYPAASYMNNFQKTVELLNVCSKADVRVVFASSAAVYGDGHDEPVSEESLCNPESPYALQKLQVEVTAALFSKLYGLKFTALRFFNVYGPGQDGLSAYSTVIASWRKRLTSGEKLRLDGDGEQSRDYIHVADVTRACGLALRSSDSGIFNIATGETTSNNEILNMLKNSYEFEINHAPARTGDVKYSAATVNKAASVLKFTSSIGIAQGIKDLFSAE